MKDFLEYTYQVIRKSLERYLYQIQQKDAFKHDQDKVQELNRQRHHNELSGSSKLRSILRDSRTNSKKLPMIDGSSTERPSQRHSFRLPRINFRYTANDISIQ